MSIYATLLSRLSGNTVQQRYDLTRSRRDWHHENEPSHIGLFYHNYPIFLLRHQYNPREQPGFYMTLYITESKDFWKIYWPQLGPCQILLNNLALDQITQVDIRFLYMTLFNLPLFTIDLICLLFNAVHATLIADRNLLRRFIFMQNTHPRLGAESMAKQLPDEVQRQIMSHFPINPHQLFMILQGETQQTPRLERCVRRAASDLGIDPHSLSPPQQLRPHST